MTTATPIVKILIFSVMITIMPMASVGCSTSLKKIDQIDTTTAKIEASIKAALIEAKEVDAAAILITVINDSKVSLSGFVSSESESSAAERLSNEAQPGLQIINELTVRN